MSFINMNKFKKILSILFFLLLLIAPPLVLFFGEKFWVKVFILINIYSTYYIFGYIVKMHEMYKISDNIQDRHTEILKHILNTIQNLKIYKELINGGK